MLSRRRAFRLLHPGLQLKFPAVYFGATLGYAAALIGVARFGLYLPIRNAVDAQSPQFSEQLGLVMQGFLENAGILTAGYVLLVLGVSFLLGSRTAGPLVAIQRHVGALTAGNFSSRVHIRRGDDLAELADTLNELAQSLQDQEKPAPDA